MGHRPLPAEQRLANGLSTLPTTRITDHHGPDGVLGEGDQLSSEGNGDVLERSGWRGSHPADSGGGPVRRRPAGKLPAGPEGQSLRASPAPSNRRLTALQRLTCTPHYPAEKT